MKPGPQRRRAAYSLVEMMIACGVFAVAWLGMWEIIRVVLILSAKNAGINISHTALQEGVDQVANQIRGCLQVVDVASFDGTTFTDINEATVSGTTASGNAVRFLRLLPVTLFVLPDDGSGYTETNAQNPQNPNYPDYLTEGNRTVNVTYNAGTTNLAASDFVADLAGARFFPRFPYLSETVTAGASPGVMPGLDIAGTPTIGTGTRQLSLTYGLPTTVQVPSCNQAYLVIVSAFAVLNRGTAYAELMYYPDASNLARSHSLSQALSVSSTGSGPLAFTLPKTAGAPSDPSARGSLQINLPVYAPNLDNAVTRFGNTAGLINVSLALPVEMRRRAQF